MEIVLVSRQLIFTLDLGVCGHELFYRRNLEDRAEISDGDQAVVILNAFEIGLEDFEAKDEPEKLNTDSRHVG